MPGPMRSIRRTRRPLLALVGLVAALVVGYVVNSTGSDSGRPRTSPPTVSSSLHSSGSVSASGDEVALSALPAQAAQTVALIRAGGPFPYPHNDGVVFHNFEHVLPAEADGYYHEYTVPTPGSDDRGARRIVTGKDGVFYYTGDHYDSFEQIELPG